MTRNLPVVQQFDRFILEPDALLPKGYAPLDMEVVEWNDLLPDNYFNADNLTAMKNRLGGWPVFTPSICKVKAVPNPEEKNPDNSGKIVLSFEETSLELVFNKTRCTQAERLTRTKDYRRWADLLPKLVLFLGVDREFARSEQILFNAAPDEDPTNGRRNGNGRKSNLPEDYTAVQANEDLFG